MCLVGIAIAASQHFPLVIAANRDELFARPAAPLDWWTPEEGTLRVLGGRDLRGGGTWLGVTPARIALVTNVREQVHVEPTAPSRGEIVEHWLRGDTSFDDLERHVGGAGFAGVNVIAFDLAAREQVHVSNRGRARTALGAGIHGLSNATIDTPWPKVSALEERLARALGDAGRREALTSSLLAALADEARAPDERLPSTGVPLPVERQLSSAFIRMPEIGYGTRCSSVIVVEDGTLTFTERTYGTDGAPAGDRTQTIELAR